MATFRLKLLKKIGIVSGLSGVFFVGCATPSSAPESLVLNPEWGKAVSVCQNTSSSTGPRIWFFKQWHLAPSANTTNIEASKSLPQYANQTAIYDQLNTWIAAGKLKTIIAEGCGGQSNLEMNSKTSARFNGWDVPALKADLSSKSYDDILTSIPLKLEAKYGEKIHTLCGDDDAMIKKNALAFSDARGELGYLSRLEQYKADPERSKLYLDGVIELYHLPTTTTIDQAITRLNTELQKSVDQIDQWIQKRNEHLVDVISSALHASLHTSDEADLAVVFGGAHAAGVEALLEKKGMNCTVVEPSGYEDDEALMLQKLKALLAQRQGK